MVINKRNDVDPDSDGGDGDDDGDDGDDDGDVDDDGNDVDADEDAHTYGGNHGRFPGEATQW